MDRITRLHAQLSTATSDSSNRDVFVSPTPTECPQSIYDTVLSPSAVAFVANLAAAFHQEVQQLHTRRQARRLATERHGTTPHFLEETRSIRQDETWQIDAQVEALMDRRVDIGDVSPADGDLLLNALNSGAQGVQVDFDDGHCPTWYNTIQGHFNVMQAARGVLDVSGEKIVESAALLVVRPRAWNMDESLEGHTEAALWRKIFEYTETKLKLAHGSIKATVLIENIFAAFEMDEILFELRHHSSGLNCGMWDYTASIVTNFRHRSEFVLPDRQQHVSMKSDFLRYYMDLLIHTCKRRHAPATTGMVPFVLAELPRSLSRHEATARAIAAKRIEALAGSDGALVFDPALVQPVAAVFSAARADTNTNSAALDEALLSEKLLTLPRGSVTLQSVEVNVRVALLFVLHWLCGRGTVVVDGCVEDSATAEISRAQLWQWVYHRVPVTETSRQVNPSYVFEHFDKM
uniref:malate synthase n=1 Tax=Hyaloperonospora arabidopsidis (strain Emoy2) TaxID=559515 RepID=M4BDG3_HYAAE